jgi:FkbM family methyltransferase
MYKRIKSEFVFQIKKRLDSRNFSFLILDHLVILPSGHRLPQFQKLYPKYDKYFYNFIIQLSKSFDYFNFIDIGANVGDTTVAVLSLAENANAVCVEGNADYIELLKANVAIFDSRVKIHAKFLKSQRIKGMRYLSNSSTGQFSSKESSSEVSFITVDEILVGSKSELSIWKSDIDGLDLPVFLENRKLICEYAKIIWIEIEPDLFPTRSEDVYSFLEFIRTSDFHGSLFDNFGECVGSGTGAEVANLVINNLPKSRKVTNRFRNAPSYFDLIIVHASIGDSKLLSDLLRSLGDTVK